MPYPRDRAVERQTIRIPRPTRPNRRRGRQAPVAMVLCGLVASIGTLASATPAGRSTIETWAYELGGGIARLASGEDTARDR